MHQTLIDSSETHADDNDHCDDLTLAPTTMINSSETGTVDARDTEDSTVQNLTQHELSSVFQTFLSIIANSMTT